MFNRISRVGTGTGTNAHETYRCDTPVPVPHINKYRHTTNRQLQIMCAGTGIKTAV
jgi:hypothetical protein